MHKKKAMQKESRAKVMSRVKRAVEKVTPNEGIEPSTTRLRVVRSTD
jgi:hypothetical protein